jgi:hypothetical protein
VANKQLNIRKTMSHTTNKREILANPEYAGHRDIFARFGIKRAMLYRLSAAGEIRSAHLKRPGATRGLRLFYIPSIRTFLEAHIDNHFTAENSKPMSLTQKNQNYETL